MIWICENVVSEGCLKGVPSGARDGVILETVSCEVRRPPPPRDVSDKHAVNEVEMENVTHGGDVDASL